METKSEATQVNAAAFSTLSVACTSASEVAPKRTSISFAREEALTSTGRVTKLAITATAQSATEIYITIGPAMPSKKICKTMPTIKSGIKRRETKLLTLTTVCLTLKGA